MTSSGSPFAVNVMLKLLICLNCPASARIISSFDFKHRTAYNISFTCYSYVNDAVFMLISRNLRKKRSEVSVKTRSTPASLSFKGQATKHTTVKCLFGVFENLKGVFYSKLHKKNHVINY